MCWNCRPKANMYLPTYRYVQRAVKLTGKMPHYCWGMRWKAAVLQSHHSKRLTVVGDDATPSRPGWWWFSQTMRGGTRRSPVVQHFLRIMKSIVPTWTHHYSANSSSRLVHHRGKNEPAASSTETQSLLAVGLLGSARGRMGALRWVAALFV